MHPDAAPATRDRGTLAAAGAGVAAVALAVLVAAAAAAVTGATRASPLADPGALVRWGRPVTGAVADLAAALAVGALVLALTALPRGGGEAHRVHPPALRLACGASVVWALAGLARLVLGYAATTGQPLHEPDLGAQLVSFVTQVEVGRWAAAAVALAASTATVAAGATGRRATSLAAVLAAGALMAEAFARDVPGGSAEGAAGIAVRAALALHVAGAAVWVGGLAALVVLARGLGGSLAAAAVRYARLATWGLALVVVSGAVAGWPRLGGGPATGYAAVLAAKVVALVALGALGVAHRRRVLPRLASGPRSVLLRAAAVELAVAVVALGLSAALAASDPPAATLAAHPGHW